MTKMVATREFGWKGKVLAKGTIFEAEANRVAGLIKNEQATLAPIEPVAPVEGKKEAKK